MPFELSLIVIFVVGFLLGSIPWGVIVSRLFYNTDVREHGSGNIGTTNALRTMGKVGGAAVFILDFVKGLLTGFFALWLSTLVTASYDSDLAVHQTMLIMVSLGFLACIWGHIFSPWLHFKGGKGIAVAVGCMFVLFGPWLTLLELGLFAVLVAITRRVSIGSLAAAIACPIIAIYVCWGVWMAWLFTAIAAATVIWAHRDNIKRLAHSEEKRFSMKGDDAS